MVRMVVTSLISIYLLALGMYVDFVMNLTPIGLLIAIPIFPLMGLLYNPDDGRLV